MNIDELLNAGPRQQQQQQIDSTPHPPTTPKSTPAPQPQQPSQPHQHQQHTHTVANTSHPEPPTANVHRPHGRPISADWGSAQQLQNSGTSGEHHVVGQTQYPAHSPHLQPDPHYRERTASTTRSSYRGSFSTSTAASSPLEAAPPHDLNLKETPSRNDNDQGISATVATIAADLRAARPGEHQNLQQQQRGLPPFSSFAEMPLAPQQHQQHPMTSDGPISPRSIAGPHLQQHQQQHVVKGGYFQNSPLQPYRPHHPYYRPQGPPPPPPPNRSDSLSQFADVATAIRDTRRRSMEHPHRQEGSIYNGIVYRSRPDGPRQTRITSIDPTLAGIDGTSQDTPHIAATPADGTHPGEQPPSETSLFCPPHGSEPTTPVGASIPADLSATPLFRGSPGPMGSERAETVREFLSRPPRCSYCNVCTTNSPLRKVVSHIFGRNKLSTRQIPKNVWVYYCRKHYQRSRYRNPHGFARQQVLLVRRQCERLAAWGGVKDWVIKVRRREEIRIAQAENPDDEEEEFSEPEGGAAGDAASPSSADSRRSSIRRNSADVPVNWITKHTGTDKAIDEVYALLDRIETEVQHNGGKFPDVELLPNVDLSLAITLDEAASPTAPSAEQPPQKTRKRRASPRSDAASPQIIKKPRASRTPVKPKSSSHSPQAETTPVFTHASQPLFKPLHLPPPGNWDIDPNIRSLPTPTYATHMSAHTPVHDRTPRQVVSSMPEGLHSGGHYTRKNEDAVMVEHA